MTYPNGFAESFAIIPTKDSLPPRRRLRLHDFPMWNNMTSEEMDEMMQIVKIKGYARGDWIFDPSHTPDRLYLLQHGRVMTYVLSPQGKKKILHIFAPGDAFGALLLGAVDGRLPWAEAMDDVVISSMDEINFRRFMLSCPNMCLDLFKYVSQIHIEAMRRLQGLLHTKAERRIVLILLDMGRRLGYDDQQELPISRYFTHEDIADMIGVVRSTVSELISQLQRQGVIKRRGRKLLLGRRAAEQYLAATE